MHKQKKSRETKGSEERSGINQGKSMPGKSGRVRPILVKSPLDTTLYAPALRQIKFGQPIINSLAQITSPTLHGQEKLVLNNQDTGAVTDEIANKVSEFIEGIRIQNEQNAIEIAHQVQKTGPSVMDNMDGLVEEARVKSSKIILDAEHFRAAVNPPAGMASVIGLAGAMNEQMLDIDDQFFHVTCHVDPGMRVKIKKGDFVDLEKLLLRMKGPKGQENKLDLVYKDGQSYFIPSQGAENWITGVHKWEQAFRIYAAIYSQANPMRAAEIWQYVHVINTAVSAYIWENVSNYDYTFRQLMASHPQRSWAKIYNQMWNISMHDNISKNNQYGANNKSNYQESSFQRQ